MTGRIGVRLKQLVLAFWALYLGMVALTNTVNFVVTVTGAHWSFLNSGNHDYIASVVHDYHWPNWFVTLSVLGAAAIEGIGALLFVRALRRYRGNRTGIVEAYQALTWNLVVWIAFIAGTEFFVAYPPEAPFRELLGLGVLTILAVAVVPDDVTTITQRTVGSDQSAAAVPERQPARRHPESATFDFQSVGRRNRE